MNDTPTSPRRWAAVVACGLLLGGGSALAGVEVGSPAPDFCLPTTSSEADESVCLQDFRGKQHVLLLFYILDFTPG